jgi:hypothetical protein
MKVALHDEPRKSRSAYVSKFLSCLLILVGLQQTWKLTLGLEIDGRVDSEFAVILPE